MFNTSETLYLPSLKFGDPNMKIIRGVGKEFLEIDIRNLDTRKDVLTLNRKEAEQLYEYLEKVLK